MIGVTVDGPSKVKRMTQNQRYRRYLTKGGYRSVVRRGCQLQTETRYPHPDGEERVLLTTKYEPLGASYGSTTETGPLSYG